VAATGDPRKAYDRLGAEFDAVMNRYDLERRLALILARVDEGAAGRVLEVGCGLGYLTDRLVRDRAVAPVSLDIAHSLLKAGRRAGRIARGVCADALVLPFRNGSFDLIVSTECIEHTPDPRAAVREMLRVARRGAALVVTCPNRAWHWSVRLANRLGVRPYHGLENWPGFGELRRWFEAEGSTVIEHVGFHALPFQLPLASRWLPRVDRVALGTFPNAAINQLIVVRAP
jgi:2-polyprenyl-6-hydroxyphenyl methylase/3-demethylubiquinone-9 3-methyltransferase